MLVSAIRPGLRIGEGPVELLINQLELLAARSAMCGSSPRFETTQLPKSESHLTIAKRDDR